MGTLAICPYAVENWESNNNINEWRRTKHAFNRSTMKTNSIKRNHTIHLLTEPCVCAPLRVCVRARSLRAHTDGLWCGEHIWEFSANYSGTTHMRPVRCCHESNLKLPNFISLKIFYFCLSLFSTFSLWSLFISRNLFKFMQRKLQLHFFVFFFLFIFVV